MLFGYPYKFMPLTLLGAICILALPWLGLIALMVVAFVGLPAIAFAIVWVPYRVVRAAIGLCWDGRSVAQPQPATAPLLVARRVPFREEQAA